MKTGFCTMVTQEYLAEYLALCLHLQYEWTSKIAQQNLLDQSSLNWENICICRLIFFIYNYRHLDYHRVCVITLMEMGITRKKLQMLLKCEGLTIHKWLLESRQHTAYLHNVRIHSEAREVSLILQDILFFLTYALQGLKVRGASLSRE